MNVAQPHLKNDVLVAVGDLRAQLGAATKAAEDLSAAVWAFGNGMGEQDRREQSVCPMGMFKGIFVSLRERVHRP
jgi:hypothetical protein